MKIIYVLGLLFLFIQSKAQTTTDTIRFSGVIDVSDTSKWTVLEPLKRTSLNSNVYRQIYIYAYNDSVTIVDSPYLHGTLFSNNEDEDTFRYVVSTWFFYEINGEPVNSVGRGHSSQDFKSYQEYIEHDVLWEIWMDRRARDYWLYSYNGRRRISFKNSNIKRAFLSVK